VVLPDLMSSSFSSSSWGATGAVRAFLEVLWGGSGQRYRCEGGLELLGRPARDWSPAGLQGEVTYLGDREQRLELPAGAHSFIVRCDVVWCGGLIGSGLVWRQGPWRAGAAGGLAGRTARRLDASSPRRKYLGRSPRCGPCRGAWPPS
jgi:hypothetical protein